MMVNTISGKNVKAKNQFNGLDIKLFMSTVTHPIAPLPI